MSIRHLHDNIEERVTSEDRDQGVAWIPDMIYRCSASGNEIHSIFQHHKLEVQKPS